MQKEDEENERRHDRFGIEIVSGNRKKKKGLHKVSFLDQVENQIKTYKDPAYADTNLDMT